MTTEEIRAGLQRVLDSKYPGKRTVIIRESANGIGSCFAIQDRRGVFGDIAYTWAETEVSRHLISGACFMADLDATGLV